MLLIHKRRSFTFVELVVVIAIIITILSFVFPPLTVMWNQALVQNAYLRVSNMLQVARARSNSIHNIVYGVLFYVEQSTGREVAVFIEAITYPITDDERWPDVCDRFQVDMSAGRYSYPMENVVRISPFDSINWEPEDILNGNYQDGKHRNLFAIIFARGVRSYIEPLILYDPDGDNDGLGDITFLPVGETVGVFGGVMRDVVENTNQERLQITTDWGFRIYDENIFREMAPDNLDLVPYLTYYLTRYGSTVLLEEK